MIEGPFNNGFVCEKDREFTRIKTMLVGIYTICVHMYVCIYVYMYVCM